LNLKDISFKDINWVIGSSLLTLFLPYSTVYPKDIRCNGFEEFISHLCPHPDYKIVTLSHYPIVSKNVLDFTSVSFKGIFSNLFKNCSNLTNIIASFGSRNNCKMLAAWIVVRGDRKNENFTQDLKSSGFGKRESFSSKWDFLQQLKVVTSPFPILGVDKIGCLALNSQVFIPVLESTLIKALKMLHYGAYIHGYVKYGASKESLEDACLEIEKSNSLYIELSFIRV